MESTLIYSNSRRHNMFSPTSDYAANFKSLQEFLLAMEYGEPETKMCTIVNLFISRRAFASLKTFNLRFGKSITDMEEELDLINLRKAFACRGIKLYDIDNLDTGFYLLDENGVPLTDSDTIKLIPNI